MLQTTRNNIFLEFYSGLPQGQEIQANKKKIKVSENRGFSKKTLKF